MPNYKTHSIHGELLLPKIITKTEIKPEDMKVYCLGPDTLIIADYRLFELQHMKNTRAYFRTLIKAIKKNKLQDNGEVMAYLYGQLDHFILDVIMHPLIYYMTDEMPKEHLIDPHALVESLIDDYVMWKYDRNDEKYYHKTTISNRKLVKLINDAYKKVYHANNTSLKYAFGMVLINIYDSLIRRDKVFLANTIIKLINLGDISYHKDYKVALPYLNNNHELWLNPETGEKHYESFDNLWTKATEVALETIQDVNLYLYQDKSIKNKIIEGDISFNTGLPCDRGQTKRFVKRYKRK